MSTDETASILKHGEHLLKVQELFSVLENDALTKDAKFPQSLSKNMQFFHWGKLNNDGRKIHTIIRVVYSDDFQTITCNLQHELEEE